jgi:hypothetical protein
MAFSITWVLPFLLLYFLMVEDLVENHVFFKASTRDIGKRKLKKDEKLLEG